MSKVTKTITLLQQKMLNSNSIANHIYKTINNNNSNNGNSNNNSRNISYIGAEEAVTSGCPHDLQLTDSALLLNIDFAGHTLNYQKRNRIISNN